jgi:hypothetical protein
VQVRHVVLGDAARPHAADGRTLGDALAAADREAAEMGEGDGVAVLGLDRQRPAARRDRAGERDDAGGRGDDCGACCPGDVDAAMLPGGIRIVPELEPLEHSPLDRPCPCARIRDEDERGQRKQRGGSSHDVPLLLSRLRTKRT